MPRSRPHPGGIAALLAPLVGLASLGCSAGPPDADAHAPNVILVSLDTVRADHLPFHGYERDTMPALAAFAQRGAVFDRAYAQAPSTVPTHASIFTGRFVFQHRTYGFPQVLDDAEQTLAEFLRERGYATFAVTSSVRFAPDAGFAQGFDHYDALYELDKNARSREVDRIAVERAAAAGERPFFAFLHYFDAHSPYAPPEPLRSRWHAGRPTPAPEETTEWLRAHRDDRVAVDADTLAYLVALYDASLRFLDGALAELFDALATAPNGRPTLWVITADHGEEFKEHGGFLHSKTLFEELLRVPLVVVYPGVVAPGQRIGEAAQSVDLFPTIADFAGLDAGALAGRSFAERLRGGALAQPYGDALRDVLVVERTRYLSVIATLPTGRFKWFGDPAKLVDLDRDPLERYDVSAQRQVATRRLAEVPRRLGVPPVAERLSAFERARDERARRAPDDDARVERLRALGYVDEVERATR